MTSLSVLSARYGIPTKSLERLFDGEGWGYDEDDFTIDRCHQKVIFDLFKKRMSPLVLAYAVYCRDVAGPDEMFVRYSNLADIANAKGLSLGESISEIRPKKMKGDQLTTAKYWLDRASSRDAFDKEAVERVASWCKLVLATAPPFGVAYPYLASRLLYSLPIEEMANFPRAVQRVINLAIHYGYLDGYHAWREDLNGIKQRVFHRAKYDL